MSKSDILCLFDVDGTLTKPRLVIDDDTVDFLRGEIAPKCCLAVVGGSDYSKILEQLRGSTDMFDHIFSENGLVARHKNEIVGCQSIGEYLGEAVTQRFINFCLKYMSELELPVKRGTFIEYRTGLINVCPVGRSCTQSERIQFNEFDSKHRVREKFVSALKTEFADLPLEFSIGGQISFDVFPKGWDKTYCLRYLTHFKEIHFFGDKTLPGGNDFEIFSHPRVVGHSVSGPADTINQLTKLFSLS